MKYFESNESSWKCEDEKGIVGKFCVAVINAPKWIIIKP